MNGSFDARSRPWEKGEGAIIPFSIRIVWYRMSETSSATNDDVRNKALASIAEMKEVVSKKEKEYRKLLKKVSVM